MVYMSPEAPNISAITETSSVLGDMGSAAECDPGAGRKCDASAFCCAVDSCTTYQQG